MDAKYTALAPAISGSTSSAARTRPAGHPPRDACPRARSLGSVLLVLGGAPRVTGRLPWATPSRSARGLSTFHGMRIPRQPGDLR